MNAFFIGLLLVAFQLARYDCAPGREYLSMDITRIKGHHNVKNVKVFEDAEVCKDERDCQWIVTETQKHGMELSEYCEIYKDAASVKQCRKTCGMCKAPAPPECKDDRNCDWIVKQAEIHGRDVADYCEAYKDTAPIKQCRRTCGMCKAPAPSDCKDERTDCQTLIDKTGGGEKLAQYCNKWKDHAAVKQCRATCNMCDAASSPIVETRKRVEECKDERLDCYLLKDKTGGGAKLKEYCNKWKDDTAVKQCPKTCGVCQEKAPSPTGECKDERNCDWIVQQAEIYKFHDVAEYCEAYKDNAPIKQCPKTCGMCNVPAPAECKDERLDCNLLEEKTGGGAKLKEYCNKWKDDPAVIQCPKTCGVCH